MVEDGVNTILAVSFARHRFQSRKKTHSGISPLRFTWIDLSDVAMQLTDAGVEN